MQSPMTPTIQALHDEGQAIIDGEEQRYEEYMADVVAAVAYSESISEGQARAQAQTTQQITESQQNCDDKLAGIFGDRDKGAVMAGSGFEPKNMPSVGGSYRGGLNGHLNNAAHLYGSADGFSEGHVYIPAGGKYIGKNPYSNEDSYMFFYTKLGNAENVTLVVSHLANFHEPKGLTRERTYVGDIGGKGGRTVSSVGIQNPAGHAKGVYIHAHLAILQGRGWETGKRLPFFDVFCK